MTSIECITYIRNKLISLIQSGQLKANWRQSKTTLSFYMNDIEGGEEMKTLRLSDHRPILKRYVNIKLTPPSDKPNTNISVEFYQKNRNKKGKVRPNKMKKTIRVPKSMRNKVKPFEVKSYSYKPKQLNNEEVERIYSAIINWISGVSSEYTDPLKDTEKAAKPQTNIAQLVQTSTKNKTTNITHNISVDKDGNYVAANGDGADYVSESIENKRLNCNKNMNKTRIRITESDLHWIVKESVNRVLKESNIIDDMTFMVQKGRYGEFDIRDTEHFIDFSVYACIENGRVELYNFSSDDKRIDQLSNSQTFNDMVIYAILDEEPQNIEGLDEFIENGDFYSFEEAIEDLKSVLSTDADTYTKYNERMRRNIKASGDWYDGWQ